MGRVSFKNEQYETIAETGSKDVLKLYDTFFVVGEYR